MKRLLILFALLGGCASTTHDAEPCVNDLAASLTGTFSSAAQAEADPDNFFDIQLVMEPIWEFRSDGPWLYVEQAAASNLHKPYRQRVYNLVDLGNGRFRSDVYTLPGNPLEYVHVWEKPAVINAIQPSNLTLREGCSITLVHKGPGEYVGSTEGKGCESNLGDAAYATSEVTLLPGTITSWDRGWTDNHTQAWGAEKGPYVFQKVKHSETITS